MSNLIPASHDSRLPDNVQDSLGQIGALDISVEVSNSLSYWIIGRVLHHMKDNLGVSDPRKPASVATGQTERLFGYCMTVNAAFEWETLRRLVERGRLRWSLLRELASPQLDDYREDLIARFEAGRMTAEEMANQITRLRGGAGEPEITDGGTDADLVVKFKKMVNKVRLLSEKLAKEAETADREFSGKGAGLDQALIDDIGGTNEETEAETLKMIGALSSALTAAASLLRRSSLAATIDRWPFDDLDTLLDQYRADYDESGRIVESEPVVRSGAEPSVLDIG